MMINRRDAKSAKFHAERIRKGVIRLIVLGVFALLNFGEVFAQDKLPKPIDPKTIFAPDVQIIETLPMLTYDNTARVINYYDPAVMDWKLYPYPADLKDDIISNYEYTSRTYLLLTKLTDWPYHYHNYREIEAEYFWVFDVVSGEFSRPIAQCGRVKSEKGSGGWVPFKAQSGNVFCNTETGETTKPLSKTFNTDSQCQSPLLGGQAISSPDGKRLIFFDCPPDITVYSYEFQTGNSYSLGVLANTENVGVNGWFENKSIILYTFNELTKLPSIYVADVTQIDSLTFIADYPIFNAPKFYWNELKEDTKLVSTSLEVHSYNVSTKNYAEILKYTCGKTPKDCISGLTFVNKANTRVAIMDNPPRAIGKGLLVYDLITQKRIYETKAQVFSELQILWADDTTLIYFDGSGSKANLHVVKFDNNGMTVDFIANSVQTTPVSSALSPDGKFLVLYGQNRIQLESVVTGKVITIAQVDDEKARFYVTLDSNRILRVGLYQPSISWINSWRIQIPDGLVAE